MIKLADLLTVVPTRRNEILVTLNRCTPLALAIVLLLSSGAALRAAAPSDTLMPATTRGFLSISDIGELAEHWNQTQLGLLVKDEAMRPFVQDMKGQLQRQLSGVRDKLGMELDDLMGVATGEIGLGMVERKGSRAALLMTVDVAGNQKAARELLVKIDGELIKRNATKSASKSRGVDLTVYKVPKGRSGGRVREAVFFIHNDLLCGTDSRAEADDVIARMEQVSSNNLNNLSNLASIEPYHTTMQRCEVEAGDLTPDLRWFVDPFGYARSVQSLSHAKRHGKDYLKILTAQGFEAIQGIGGFVNLSVPGQFEVLHRTFVYAPPVDTGEQKYKLAMQMLNFPNSNGLQPDDFIPRKLASYRTFNIDLQNAFDHFDTLFDSIAGYDDAFKSMIEGLETDPFGPRVKVREEFIKHLGNRISLVTDYELPITTSSERFLFVLDITDQAAIERVVKKFMEANPDARLRTADGQQIWEIVEPEDDYEDLNFGIEEFDPLAAPPEKNADAIASSKASAVCVADGKLLIASHVDFLKEILAEKPKKDSLAAASDFVELESAMSQLVAGPVCARCFVRTDEAYRPTYELLRKGMMPKSKTLLGRVLNRMLTPPEDEDEGILRKQKIDGRNLPSFEEVRHYFSPGGTIVRSDEDGWMAVGAVLAKRNGQARAGIAPSASASKIR